MSRTRALAPTVLLAWATGACMTFGAPQSDYDRITQLWFAQDWENAYRSAFKYRDGRGPDLHIDYVLGTSACRIPKRRGWGQRFLIAVHKERLGTLKKRQRELIAKEIGKCSPPWSNQVQTYYAGLHHPSHWIGSGGAPWLPPGAQEPEQEPVDSEGEDLNAITLRSITSPASSAAIFKEAEAKPE